MRWRVAVKVKKSLLVTTLAAVAVLFVAALVIVPAASADTIFVLNKDGCSGNCLNAANPSAGTVTLHQFTNGSGYQSVNVTVALNSAFGFIDTGAHDTFTFTSDLMPITVSGMTAGFTYYLPPGNNPPFGTFGVYIDCNSSGNPYCGNGASHPIYGTLSFNVSYSGGNLTISDFIGNDHTPPIYFAADVFSNSQLGGTGKTGAVGAGGPGVSTPEPSSLALLGSGLLALGGLVRRRKQ
jgi:hypothetical protein